MSEGERITFEDIPANNPEGRKPHPKAGSIGRRRFLNTVRTAGEVAIGGYALAQAAQVDSLHQRLTTEGRTEKIAQAEDMNGLRAGAYETGILLLAQAFLKTPYEEAIKQLIPSDNTKDIVHALENGQRERRHVTYLRTLTQARKSLAELYPDKDPTWRENLGRMISYIGVRDAVDPTEGGSFLFDADRWFGLVRNLGYPIQNI